MQKYLVLDFETRSEADIKKVGAFEYAMHDSTQIMCCAWRYGTRAELRKQIDSGNPAKLWAPNLNSNQDDEIWRSGEDNCEWMHFLGNALTKVVAHNAFFEQSICKRFLTWTTPVENWICTASLARALALPGNLESAGAALGTTIQKDKEGHRLMLKLSKPRKATLKSDAPWHEKAEELKRLYEYCQTDVDAETLLFLTLPPLNETERAVWELDQKINFRGFAADRKLVKCALELIGEETDWLNMETEQLTRGKLRSTNQRDLALKWLSQQGLHLTDLTAKTVNDTLKSGMAQGDAKRLLEIRKAVSKSSTAKYEAFEMRSRYDGRVRDNLVYHAASTGRWGGSGVQPQNFPRGTVKRTDLAVADIKGQHLDWVRALHGDPMEVLSSCLRSVIVAPKGKELFCADFASIEARVLFWMADNKDGLKAFREGRPIYEEMAQTIYRVQNIEDVTPAQRQLGKAAILGCGYGMGAPKFLQTCKNFGIEIDEELANIAVKAYRNAHAPVVKFWGNVERAAVAAVKKPASKFAVNRTVWWKKGEFLWCELPSGRRLAYASPIVKFEESKWSDEKRAVLYHRGVAPMSRKWVESGTYGGRLVENVVQACARDLMAEAMLRIDAAGYEIILSVHDELLAELVKDKGSVAEFETLMAQTPGWALDCPVEAKGWKGDRYRK